MKNVEITVEIRVKEVEGYGYNSIAKAELTTTVEPARMETGVNDAILTAQSEIDRQFLTFRRAERQAQREAEMEA